MSQITVDDTERIRRWREIWSIYLIMTLGTLAVDQLASVWPIFASFSVLLVALGFIFLPTEYLIKRGESPRQFGIGGRIKHHELSQVSSQVSSQETSSLSNEFDESSLQRAWRCTKQALWISLLIFPLFIAGNHLWRSLQGQSPDFSLRALSRWDESIRGLSKQKLSVGEINTSASLDHVKLTWRLKADEQSLTARLYLDASAKIIGKSSRDVQVRALPSEKGSEIKKWQVTGQRQGYVLLKTASTQVQISAQTNQKNIPKTRLSWGEYHQSSDSNRFDRDFNWLWSIFLIQLFLVGLPEEIFYRGYLQTRLDSLIGQDRKVFGVDFNWKSTVLCSALFAIAHLMTILHPSRLAVFFPSLLFGWMRRAYGDTLTPAMFHAACNVLSQVLWGIYFI